jgi:histidine triad (HIT) family protein
MGETMTMPTDPNCIFCKIVAGKIPSFKVYEDDTVFAFVDIGPIVDGHVLVVPKGHYASLLETPAEVNAAVNERIPRIAKAVIAAVGKKACHVLTNAGAEASQSVGHLHYHILPRSAGDGYHLEWPARKLDMAAGKQLAEGIVKRLGGE